MADDDNFDIDIYGDESGPNYQDATAPQAPKQPNTVAHDDSLEPTMDTTEKPRDADAADKRDSSVTGTNGTSQQENGTQQISSTGASANNQAFLKQAPQQQGVKRKQGEDDDRPMDPGATAALMINDLNWWISEEDIRGWANQGGCEDELNEVTFNEHKVNGKSKGQVYVQLQSPQAATALKHQIEALYKDQTHTKKPTAIFNPPHVNPFKTLPKDVPQRDKNRGDRSSSGNFGNQGGQGGNFNRFNNQRGNFNNRGNMGFQRGGFSGPAGNMGGNMGGFGGPGPMNNFGGGPMGGMNNFGGGNFNRGGMMGGAMRGGMNNRGRGGMGMNNMGGMNMPMANNMMGMGGAMGMMGGNMGGMMGGGMALLQGVLAENAPYAQCGGTGYTGETSCPSGYTCQAQNDWYHQCVPGTAATSSSIAASSAKTSSVATTKTSSTVTTLVTSPTTSASASASASATSGAGVKCTGTFTPVSASAFVKNINPGWNLGNTLDAVEDEGDWNNPKVTEGTFDDIKAAGFKGIRLPVTWAYHFTSGSPSWDVDAAWLQRVSDVVDMITAREFYTIVNVHHDSWVWADVTASGANLTQIEEKFYRLWYQIGTKLACKSSLVAFEPINEPPGTTAEHGAELNKLNGIFLQALADSGGFNTQRVVTLVGAGEDSVKTSQWFQRPDAKYKNPWAIQYHYYSPYDFIFSAWGKTIWGSDADKATLDADFAAIRNNFTDVPLIIGEWDASSVQTETAARWKYFDFLIRTANKYNTATVLWDNGADHFNRATHQWRDPTALSILTNAAAGKTNSLPESTTDVSATSQSSSAYAYHKAGAAVTDTVLPYLFNGNTLSSIKNTKTGTALTKGTDYSSNSSAIVLTASFLKTVITSSTATGSLANLTVTFSSGGPTNIDILQYATPVLGSTTQALPATSVDLSIPITWKGQNRPATVKAIKSDGGILIDDWTQYLGSLQQGRLTYSGQWDWDANNVILKSAVLDAVRSAGKTTTFTWEFYPREPTNVANFTLTV
ncbi:uncharacterized protein N0V89_003081 [Didymosphaeria variabile]|uniref:CBM1 domain-containing protein n=1 Tax=Didymosphaeria variabile TaxID=1932322 RepID=A0A9W8XSU8_9PLEO|nr:uncharacterized protein N0V89_003081 [Didymosphaeria variabile]KAJ4358497.1 hypothetical protein N0V89_003081 [Didymosphaeria variabile]